MVWVSLQRTREAAERVLMAFRGGEEEAQQNLWVLQTGEQQLNGQMGQLFLAGTACGRPFLLRLGEEFA